MKDGAASMMPPADWLPTQEGLLRGLNHALSNRASSLGAIAMLTEGAATLDPKIQAALTKDVEQLGELLALYRLLPAEAVARREASRFDDAITRAIALLEHHPDCRNVRFAVAAPEVPPDPVALLGRDALKASVMLLLGAARGTGGEGTVEVATRGVEGWLHVVARAPRADPAIRASRECAVLSRWADEEGGRLDATADALELVLPGLSRNARAERAGGGASDR
jgi:hypothetical protein